MHINTADLRQKPGLSYPGLFLLSLLILLSACQKPQPEYTETRFLFGTLVEFIIRDVPEETARKAVAEIGADFQRMHRDWHAWKPGELSRLNAQLPDGQFHEVSSFLLPVIRQAKQLSIQSDDLFNPAIGRLIALWGFHNDTLPLGPPPPREAIAALVAQRPRMEDVDIEGQRVRSRNPAVALDFGGFAKGVALDHAVRRLAEFGIHNAIINAGGDLNAIGQHGNRLWRVGVRDPSGQGLVASLEVTGAEAVYTSGNYERYREHEGIRYSHIIDPRTGMPVEHIVSATVIDTSGARADAAATALSVAGPAEWERIARRMHLRNVMLIDENGRVYMSRPMAERVRLEGVPPAQIQVVDLERTDD